MTGRGRLAIVGWIVAIAVVGPAAVASAHPLGNFTINTSALLVVSPHSVAVDYVIDMAEIPAFREQQAIDADADGEIDPGERAAYAAGACARAVGAIDLRGDGDRIALAPEGAPSLTFPAGSGGLTTLRLECHSVGRLAAAIAEGDRVVLRYVDRNLPEATGWREVIAAGDGATLVRSDVPEASTTDRLRAYPDDAVPLDVRTATLVVTGGGPRLVASPEGVGGPETGADGGVLASLVGRPDLTPRLVALTLLVAFGVGAVHALGPGHGKTLIGAYLVGGGGTIRDATSVGIAVSLMHTASVLALGAVVLAAERVASPERIYPWLGIVAGLLAVALGLALLFSRIATMRGASLGDHEHADHEHAGHEHHHLGDRDAGRPTASAAPGPRRRAVLALAFSGGALPSPTALVTFLGAVSVGRATFGLALIGAFSLGLAAALLVVGIAAIRAADLGARRLPSRVTLALPVASALAIVAMGVLLATRGVTQL